MDFTTGPVIERLKAVLATKLAADIREMGDRLLIRLTTPVRVSIIGRRGSGKKTLSGLLMADPELADFRFAITTLNVAPAPVTSQMAEIAGQSDMVLWCGTAFDHADRALWAGLPNTVKDHSFWVLTKADVLAENALLTAILTPLQDSIIEEFQGLHPIATLQAIAAQRQQDDAAFRASGGAALRAAIRRDATAARRALDDSAMLFLRGYGPATRTATDISQPTLPALQINKTIWAKAHLLVEHAAKISPIPLDSTGPDRATVILTHCCETADTLVNQLNQDAAGQVTPLHDDIMTAADTLLLMRIEGGSEAAVDALTLLLQIRREIAECLID